MIDVIPEPPVATMAPPVERFSALDFIRLDLEPITRANEDGYRFFTTPAGDDVLEMPKEDILPVLRTLKENGRFDFLMDVCGVDYPERQKTGHENGHENGHETGHETGSKKTGQKINQKRFEVVYELFSSKTAQRLRLRCAVGEGESIASAVGIWKGANWFERETWDMFGITFTGHPNLTRLLTHHEFVGHPLRKDYEADRQQPCSVATPLHFEDGSGPSHDPNRVLTPLNIGPSHPATHGTLRIMAELEGETITRANLEIGYLHRCFEKMAETHPYNQVIPYTDRLNYCSAPMNNVGYCKAVERLLGVEIPPKAQAMRMILAELSRIIDHLVCIGANALDLGALTTFFHLFTYREKVYTLFERLCGARLTVSLTRIGGMAQDAPAGWFNEVLGVADEIEQGISDLETLLSGNKIWINRTQGVGPVTPDEAKSWGYTGPCLRATGVALDLRKTKPYYLYDQIDFDIPVGANGDVYDRYLVRVEEMRQSVRIVRQLCKNVPAGDYTIRDKGIVLPEKKDVYGNIEGLMNHFMLVIKGLRPPVGEIYDATEAANGELGFYLVSDGTGRPYRLHARAPCFAIYQSFAKQITGGVVSDVVSILGSINVIAGELDR